MSTLFFDNILDLGEVEKEIRNITSSDEEKDEFNGLVDGLITTWVLDKVFDNLPEEYHEEFLTFFLEHPHEEDVVFGFLDGKIGGEINIKDELKKDSENFSSEILSVLRPQDEVSRETKVPVK
jgi:hypothetical protein